MASPLISRGRLNPAPTPVRYILASGCEPANGHNFQKRNSCEGHGSIIFFVGLVDMSMLWFVMLGELITKPAMPVSEFRRRDSLHSLSPVRHHGNRLHRA